MAGAETATFGAHRRALLHEAEGRVIEIGGGTGVNLEYYGGGIERLVVAEPEAPMARRLAARAQRMRKPVEIVDAGAEALPFPDASFDVAVVTLVLCTVPDQGRALAEIRRVLVPGGRLLFLEHVRAADARTARWQDRLNPVQNVLGRGCNCNRDTLAAIRAAGFSAAQVKHDEVRRAPPIVRPIVLGTAYAPGT